LNRKIFGGDVTEDNSNGSEGRQQDRLGVRNMGEPIRLAEINFAGISAGAARGGDTVEIWTRLSLSSDESLFQKIIGNIAAAIEHSARLSGTHCSLNRANTVLLVIRPDNSGELWIDTAAMCNYSTLKRPGPLQAGTVLFENDIADVTGIWFPLVEIGPKDRILCLFREGWRFGLFFDFNPDGDLAIEDAKRALAALYRKMRYADLYTALAHQPTFGGLVAAGWFPFLELMSGEFRTLLESHDAGFELDDPERALLEKFDEARLDRMFARWLQNSHLKARETILGSAIRAFKAKDPVSVIKNVLSEIEGIMSDAYFQEKSERTHRIDKLLAFIISFAEQKVGGEDTLFFPVAFGKYLRDYTYAGFHPGDVGRAGSRHAVSHGAVASDQYTMTRALQAILTLDQIGFYI